MLQEAPTPTLPRKRGRELPAAALLTLPRFRRRVGLPVAAVTISRSAMIGLAVLPASGYISPNRLGVPFARRTKGGLRDGKAERLAIFPCLHPGDAMPRLARRRLRGR